MGDAPLERILVASPSYLAGRTSPRRINDLLLGGAGVAILPRLSVQRELDERRLVHLLPGYVAPGPSFYLLLRGGRFLAPKIRAFVDFVRAALPASRGSR